MSDFNSQHNRAVWLDVPVTDLDRACAFYAAVLGCRVDAEEFDGFKFAVIEHRDGNGGCLVPMPDQVSDKGLIVYFNADGRIRDAVHQAEQHGGTVLEPVKAIGPHGFRALVKDSEGNRVALHSNTDA
jgi:hypothetical protein